MLKVGEEIKYMGVKMTVGMVGNVQGERYYWLIDDDVDYGVAMIPASVLEEMLGKETPRP